MYPTNFDSQLLGMLNTVEQELDSIKFTENPTIIFLAAFHAALLRLGVEEEVADIVTENMTTKIHGVGDGQDRERFEMFGHRWAQVCFKALGHPDLKSVSPVLRRAVLKGMSFTYND